MCANITSLNAQDIFVFFGAGASRSPPSNLPQFDSLREEILVQLKLFAYVEGCSAADPGKVVVARSLTPEPFFGDLIHAGVDVEGWLALVLGRGMPNAAHRAAAALAEAGARVWTVNFDRLIEAALTSPVTVSQWPDEPEADARILKPHGSIGGRLIVSSDQVLRELSPAWEAKLRADVADRTVVFLGYSGRDLDFRPIWGQVLAAARRVMWFELRDPEGEIVGGADKRRLMRDMDARGLLDFPPPAPPPAGVPAAAAPNPSWDFVVWCTSSGLVSPDPDEVRRLFDERPALSYPPLQAAPFARTRMLGHLGDYRAVRNEYLHLIATSAKRKEALSLLADSELTHLGPRLSLALRPLMLTPDRIGGAWKPRLRRKLLTADHRGARHRRVLRATRTLRSDDVSTLLILRSSALRICGSLEEAERVADEGFSRARHEGHSVRVAHAAYQQCMALVWADRVDEARDALETRLRPYAKVAANRWVAWADFVEGELAVREPDVAGATAAYDAAAIGFGAELLTDALIGVATARLTVERLDGDDLGFERRLQELRSLRRTRRRGGLYYTRGNAFTSQAIDLERAEFARTHLRDPREAARLYSRLAGSPYPLHQAFGALGLALVNTEISGADVANRERARRVGQAIGQRLVLQRVSDLETGAADALAEFFFC